MVGSDGIVADAGTDGAAVSLRAMTRLPDLRDLRAPLLAWTLLALVSIFLHGPLPLYSTRTLAVAWEMWDQGSWLVPLFNGAPYSHKTPLLFWMIHAGWMPFGVNDVWPRLLVVSLGAAAIAQTGLLARRLYPEAAGLPKLSAWAMAGFWYLFLFSLQVMYELVLMVAVLAGLLSLCRRDGVQWRPWWPGVALAVGFGLLAKGPVALLHIGVPLLAARWWHPLARADGVAFARRAFLALLGGVAMFALWLVPALVLGDAEYREALLVTQTAGRIRDSFDHAAPVWWYLPTLLLLMAPWWWSSWWWRQLPALWCDPGNRLAWCWLLGALACFSLVSGKQAYYLLPECAAIALLLARAAHARPRLGVAAGGLALLCGLPLASLPLWAAHVQAPFPHALLLTMPLAGIAISLLGLAMLRWRSLPVHAGGVLLAIASFHAAATPLLRGHFDLVPTARLLGDAQRQGEPLAFVGEYQLQFHFAGRLREPIEVLEPANARAWAEAHPRGLIVVTTRMASDVAGHAPVLQQRFRQRWVQVWRADDWRRLPDPQLPLQSAAGYRRAQPR